VPGHPVHYRNGLSDSGRWDGFAFRPGDIVVSTPSKCGTTWVQMICALLVFQSAEFPAPLTLLSPWWDMRLRPVEETRAILDAQAHRRFIKTHTPLDGLPTAADVTYLVAGRDPRDVAVSLAHHRANLNRDVLGRLLPAPPPGVGSAAPTDPREQMLAWFDDDAPPTATLSSLRSLSWHLSGAWARRAEPQVVLVHYADLCRDLEGQMRRLAERLGVVVTEQRWPGLVAAATFDRMRARSADLVPDERLGLLTDTRRFFHSGSSGQWRELLTSEDLDHYDRRVTSLVPADLVPWLHQGEQAAAT
jgi:hypothetical protein